MSPAAVHRQAVSARARPHHRRGVRRADDQHRGEASQTTDLGHGELEENFSVSGHDACCNTKRQNELFCEVWKLFSQSCSDVPTQLPSAMLPNKKKTYQNFRNSHLVEID